MKSRFPVLAVVLAIAAFLALFEPWRSHHCCGRSEHVGDSESGQEAMLRGRHQVSHPSPAVGQVGTDNRTYEISLLSGEPIEACSCFAWCESAEGVAPGSQEGGAVISIQSPYPDATVWLFVCGARTKAGALLASGLVGPVSGGQRAELLLGSPSTPVMGRIVMHGAPVAEATVFARPRVHFGNAILADDEIAQCLSASSDTNGYFSLPALGTLSYSLLVAPDDRFVQPKPVDIDATTTSVVISVASGTADC
jgi:hypothetical protein